MKINKVEELAGISKKNIRFYEEKGLLTPARNPENSYREYSEADVEMLRKIKLLRQLSVPIEEILKLQKGSLTLEDGMRRHIIWLNREEANLKHQQAICSQLAESGESLRSLATDKYLELMEELEKGGVRFMNVEHVDRSKKAPVIAALVMIILMLCIIGIFAWAATVDPIPVPILLIVIAIPLAVIAGVLLALKERIKQLEGGEEDEARKY